MWSKTDNYKTVSEDWNNYKLLRSAQQIAAMEKSRQRDIRRFDRSPKRTAVLRNNFVTKSSHLKKKKQVENMLNKAVHRRANDDSVAMKIIKSLAKTEEVSPSPSSINRVRPLSANGIRTRLLDMKIIHRYNHALTSAYERRLHEISQEISTDFSPTSVLLHSSSFTSMQDVIKPAAGGVIDTSESQKIIYQPHIDAKVSPISPSLDNQYGLPSSILIQDEYKNLMALKIQTRWRMVQSQRKLKILRKIDQKKKRKERRHLILIQRHAADRIKRIWLGYRAKEQLYQLKINHQEKEKLIQQRQGAILTLQKSWRRHNALKKYHERKRSVEIALRKIELNNLRQRHYAAVRIQRWWLMLKAKSELRILKQMMMERAEKRIISFNLRNAAVSKIQLLWLRHRAKSVLDHLKIRKRKIESSQLRQMKKVSRQAATKVQSVWRGRVCRQLLKDYKQEHITQNQSSMKIQKLWRRRRIRKRLELQQQRQPEELQSIAISKIQAYWRKRRTQRMNNHATGDDVYDEYQTKSDHNDGGEDREESVMNSSTRSEWVEGEDEYGQTYYYNIQRRLSSWDPPDAYFEKLKKGDCQKNERYESDTVEHTDNRPLMHQEYSDDFEGDDDNKFRFNEVEHLQVENNQELNLDHDELIKHSSDVSDVNVTGGHRNGTECHENEPNIKQLEVYLADRMINPDPPDKNQRSDLEMPIKKFHSSKHLEPVNDNRQCSEDELLPSMKSVHTMRDYSDEFDDDVDDAEEYVVHSKVEYPGNREEESSRDDHKGDEGRGTVNGINLLKHESPLVAYGNATNHEDGKSDGLLKELSRVESTDGREISSTHNLDNQKLVNSNESATLESLQSVAEDALVISKKSTLFNNKGDDGCDRQVLHDDMSAANTSASKLDDMGRNEDVKRHIHTFSFGETEGVETKSHEINHAHKVHDEYYLLQEAFGYDSNDEPNLNAELQPAEKINQDGKMMNETNADEAGSAASNCAESVVTMDNLDNNWVRFTNNNEDFYFNKVTKECKSVHEYHRGHHGTSNRDIDGQVSLLSSPPSSPTVKQNANKAKKLKELLLNKYLEVSEHDSDPKLSYNHSFYCKQSGTNEITTDVYEGYGLHAASSFGSLVNRGDEVLIQDQANTHHHNYYHHNDASNSLHSPQNLDQNAAMTWTIYWSAHYKVHYYFNELSNIHSWEMPPDLIYQAQLDSDCVFEEGLLLTKFLDPNLRNEIVEEIQLFYNYTGEMFYFDLNGERSCEPPISS